MGVSHSWSCLGQGQNVFEGESRSEGRRDLHPPCYSNSTKKTKENTVNYDSPATQERGLSADPTWGLRSVWEDKVPGSKGGQECPEPRANDRATRPRGTLPPVVRPRKAAPGWSEQNSSPPAVSHRALAGTTSRPYAHTAAQEHHTACLRPGPSSGAAGLRSPRAPTARRGTDGA